MNKKGNKSFLYTFNRIIYTAILTFLSSLVFIMEFKPANGTYLENHNETYKFLIDIYNSLRDFDVVWVLLIVFIFYFYYNVFFNSDKSKKGKVLSALVSLWFVGVTIVGKCFAIDNSLRSIYCSEAQIIKTILLSIGYFIIFYSLCISIINFRINIVKKKSQSRVGAFFDKHCIAISIISMFLAWIPLMIIYYPCVASGDTVDSLAQFFNVEDLCWSAKAINLINDNVIINKHHSVLFTMILGNVVKFGYYILSYSFGIFLFIILQVAILIAIFTFLIYYLKKIKTPTWMRVFALLFFCLSPIVSSYAIAAIKDTLGAILILFYNICLFQIIRNYDGFVKKKIFVIAFMICILLILMIKSNSMYVIITSYATLLFAFWKSRKKLKKLVMILLLPLTLFLGYDKILLPSLDVTGTNIKESYSVQFMQIARLAHKNKNAISDSDKEIIDKVLDYEAISRDYTPDLSDPVKNTYRKDVTEEELDDFWKVYFKYFKKYPKVYIASFINGIYAYFFPEVGETKGIIKIDNRIGDSSKFKIVNLDKFEDARYINKALQDIFIKLPFFSFFNHVAFHDWFLILSVIYIIKKKCYKYIVPISSLIAIFLSCLISPVNGSFRYILPIVFSVPLILAIDYFAMKKGEVN